jgi:hypothetical protein
MGQDIPRPRPDPFGGVEKRASCQAPGPLPRRGRRPRPSLVGRSLMVHAKSAGPPTATAPVRRRGRRPPSGHYGPRGGGPVTLRGRRGPGGRQAQPPPRALPRTCPTSASMTPVLTDPIRWFHPVRGWSHDRLALAPPSSRSEQGGSGRPRPALRVPAGRPGPAPGRPPASAGWVAGAVVVRSGWVSRGRLAAAAGVTGTLALLAVGPTAAASRLLGAVAAALSTVSCRPP